MRIKENKVLQSFGSLASFEVLINLAKELVCMNIILHDLLNNKKKLIFSF